MMWMDTDNIQSDAFSGSSTSLSVIATGLTMNRGIKNCKLVLICDKLQLAAFE